MESEFVGEEVDVEECEVEEEDAGEEVLGRECSYGYDSVGFTHPYHG